MQIKTLGIIGYGSFGSFVHEITRHYIPDIAVRVYSSRFPTDNTTFFSLEDTCKCDALVLAVPIHAFKSELERVLPLLAVNTIIVDIATVKMYTTTILQEYKYSLRYVAMHPMFGPYSYLKKGRTLAGLRIVLTGHSIMPEEYEVLKKFSKQLGLVVLETTPEDHDQTLAETLFLTHYMAQVITKAGYRRTEIDTVSFGFLMDAVESVQNDTELFQDVFRFNPYCQKVIDQIDTAEQQVHQMLAKRSSK
ncbi:prephenate dehydrogenase/arogenate dehydrogenase family protein, partial [Amaricoccus sp.]